MVSTTIRPVLFSFNEMACFMLPFLLGGDEDGESKCSPMCGVAKTLNERKNREQNGQCGCYRLGYIYSQIMKSQLSLRK